MKALRFENQELAVREVARPDAFGEALVRVTLSGICNTDLEITRGYAGFAGTLGHEFVGVIENVQKPDRQGGPPGCRALPHGRASDRGPTCCR